MACASRAAAPWGGYMTIRVVIADDQEIIRTGLATILGAQPDIEVVGLAGLSGDRASGDDAAAVAHGQGAPLSGGGGALGPADVERDPRVEHGGGQGRQSGRRGAR